MQPNNLPISTSSFLTISCIRAGCGLPDEVLHTAQFTFALSDCAGNRSNAKVIPSDSPHLNVFPCDNQPFLVFGGSATCEHTVTTCWPRRICPYERYEIG